MIKFTIIGSLFLVLACNSAKDISTEQITENLEQEKEMLAQGFTKGTIVYSDIEGDCEYTIKLDDGRFFESTDLKEDFKKDGKIVWFTYGPLRRMNKCEKASPVSIIEMK
ncbi:glycyl-tRNA synthetase [unidentified eubacterium SCB49]|nr:glycyl-tRNA synthetase [unidentified eubacterium SCB49]